MPGISAGHSARQWVPMVGDSLAYGRGYAPQDILLPLLRDHFKILVTFYLMVTFIMQFHSFIFNKHFIKVTMDPQEQEAQDGNTLPVHQTPRTHFHTLIHTF